MSKKKSLTKNQSDLLKYLAECDKGKGRQLNEHGRRIAGPLIKLGYVMWIEAAFLRVYLITDKGRKVSELNNETENSTKNPLESSKPKIQREHRRQSSKTGRTKS